jgi:hypothetical protein
MTEDEVLATARRLLGAASGWSLRSERRGGRLSLIAEHPASSGMVLDLEVSDPKMAQQLDWFCGEREIAVASAAPPLVHPDVVLGVRALARAFEWPTREVKAVAFLMFEAGALSVDETSWLAGYVAEDAPMERVSPLGP